MSSVAKFRLRQIVANVSVWDGQTVVLGDAAVTTTYW